MNNILDVITISWGDTDIDACVLRKVGEKTIVVFDEKIALVNEELELVTLLDIEDVFPL